MSEFAAGIAEDLAERFAPAVQQVTDQIRDDIKELISEPYPPASEPNTPPHERTGNYKESQQVEEVTVTPESVHGAAFTDEQLGEWLEHGTERMAARPHFSVIAEEWNEKITEEIKSAL
jgi:hypothetical protein